MTSIENTVLNLIQASLFNVTNSSCGVVHVVDNFVFLEMKDQAVAALPQIYLRTHPLPDTELQATWSSFSTRQQGHWIQVMHGEDQLVHLLEENGIPCVIIKGAAAAMAYPHPSLRMAGDVDCLVKRSDFARAVELLEKNGFVSNHEKNDSAHHYGYEKDGVLYELHKRLGIVSEENEELIGFFEKGIDQREWHEVEGYKVPTFPPVLNGMTLLFHINQHLREGLGLRQIIDWMMYLTTISVCEWIELRERLRTIELERLAIVVTYMCEKYMGLRSSFPLHTSYEVDEAVVDSLMELILNKGNFGSKAGLSGKMESFCLSSTERGGFFRRLQRGGLSTWNAAKKYRILRPFAWIYQAQRCAGIVVSNKIGLKGVLKNRTEGKKQRQLIDALGLKVDRTI